MDKTQTDGALLEAAAKVISLKYHAYVDHPLMGKGINIGDSDTPLWNPLADDGDALRLARTLRMTLADEPSRGGWSAGSVVAGEFKWLAHDNDLNRAIVRAAAAIGNH